MDSPFTSGTPDEKDGSASGPAAKLIGSSVLPWVVETKPIGCSVLPWAVETKHFLSTLGAADVCALASVLELAAWLTAELASELEVRLASEVVEVKLASALDFKLASEGRPALLCCR
mmetsp:Transcript_736/g.2001  ORF Transcript_736/g.2001 Transcript_736/m.2001 type:complete len:117 (+) Transcript_736:866-1216(+)